MDIAGYDPSGSFKEVVKQLIPGDIVRVSGGVKLVEGNLTLNLEKLETLKLITKISGNPVCPRCKKSMKSEGRGKGYQCKKCGFKASTMGSRELQRGLVEGIYLPPPRAMRHLTKPFLRYGIEKQSWKRDVEEFYNFF